MLRLEGVITRPNRQCDNCFSKLPFHCGCTTEACKTLLSESLSWSIATSSRLCDALPSVPSHCFVSKLRCRVQFAQAGTLWHRSGTAAAQRNATRSSTTFACEWVAQPVVRRASICIVDFPDADVGYRYKTPQSGSSSACVDRCSCEKQH